MATAEWRRNGRVLAGCEICLLDAICSKMKLRLTDATENACDGGDLCAAQQFMRARGG